MRVMLGSDALGVDLCRALAEHLTGAGAEVVLHRDADADADVDVDYPDVAVAVARAVRDGLVDRAVLVCGTGIGMCIAANKVRGVRAATVSDPYSAERAMRSNDAHILCLGSRVVGPAVAPMLVDVWLSSGFEGGRSEHKVRKLRLLDAEPTRTDAEVGGAMTLTTAQVADRLDAPVDLGSIPAESAVSLYAGMVRIREFEQRVNSLFLQGKIPGTIHLSLGQEACAVGATSALRQDDWITITHRGHGQALAKGVSARGLMAELFARDGGCCRGHGGSLHVGDIRVGAVPGIAIVGASVPITAGIAYAFKAEASHRIALCFTGDGAMGEGDTHEGLNLAALWQLPVIYLCENNRYSISTPLERQFRNADLAARAASYGMQTATVDGNDVVAVHQVVSEHVAALREGRPGPVFIECLTYRQGGHKRDDPGSYRPADEVSLWMRRDPITRMRSALEAAGLSAPADAAEHEATAEIDDAVAFAEASPPATLEVFG